MRKMTWVGGLILILASVASFAGDGIPVGNAVFYPAVEGVYTSTDNLFLLDSSMPGGEESDSFWTIRPSLGIELPLEQSYFRFDLAYQYKDYQDFDLDEHNAWFLGLVSNFKFSNGATFFFKDHYVRGVQEINQVDPGYEATFNNAPFDRNFAQIGFTLPVNKLNTFGFELNHNMVDFSNENSYYQAFYGYDTLNALVNWKYHFNASNSVVAEYTYTDNDQDESSYGSGIPIASRDYDGSQLMVGWEGSFTARASGMAMIGYKEMNFDNYYDDFSGFVGEAKLGFKFSEFIRGDLNLYRRAHQSAYNVNNYFTATGGEFQVEHQVTRYFFWSAGALMQKNKYPDAFVANMDGVGGEDSIIYGLPMDGADRKDDISRLRAEVGFHFTQQVSLRVNYQYEDRDSNVSFWDADVVYRPYSYTENRFAFQLQLGW